VNWIGWIFALALAAILFGAVTDASFTKCRYGSLYAYAGLCTPSGL
jgi:hypothetical protein